jgi:acetoin utilization protein AcuB
MIDIRIGAVMTAAPRTIPEDSALDQARGVMRRNRIHHLPVTSGNQLTGMLTDRDLNLVAYLANDLLPESEITAGDACVPEPFTTAPDARLSDVLEGMAARRVGSALVVDQGRLVGIFTSHDACSLLARHLRSRGAALAISSRTTYAIGPRVHAAAAVH